MLLIIFGICLAVGAIVGFLAGLLGIGGGLVIVPVLVFVLPLFDIQLAAAMPIAVATSLASIVITSSFAAYVHKKNQNIPWDLTKMLASFVAVGAVSGGFIADSISAEILTYIFSGAVILLALYMLASIRLSQEKGEIPSKLVFNIIGIFTGLISSLMGISGGAILIPVLSYCHINIRHAIGIASVCGVLVALFGSLGFVIAGIGRSDLPSWSIGYVYLPALAGLVATSSLFAPAGARLANKLPVDTIKKLFAAFLILVAIKMMIN